MTQCSAVDVASNPWGGLSCVGECLMHILQEDKNVLMQFFIPGQ